MIRTGLLGAVLAAALVAASCGSAGTPKPPTAHGIAGAQATVRRCAGARRPVGSRDAAWAGILLRPTIARIAPDGAPLARFGLANANGYSTVFSIVGEQLDTRCRPVWLHVELPIRPNGATGWVRASDVRRSVVHEYIAIDLSEKRLRLYRHDRAVFGSPIAVGSPATPTPVGRYYVKERLIPSDPSGPWGPYALGLSAYSPVLRGWMQGGPIGIHGTNAPWSIGHAVSHGCIRLPNAAVKMLFVQTPAGTPVYITR